MTGCCGGGEVWIDPAELNRTASLLIEQSGRIQETVDATTSCCGVASRSGVPWVDEALAAATAEAMRVAAAYLVEAGDLNHRANEVILEEAGATTDVATGATTQATYTPGATVTPAPAGSGWQQFQSGDVGFLGGGLEQFAAGLMGKLAGTNLTPGPGGTIDPQARFNVPGGVDPTSAVARAQMNLSSQHGDDIATLFQPPGVGSVDGHPVDDSGRSGTDNQLNTDFGGDSHFGDY